MWVLYLTLWETNGVVANTSKHRFMWASNAWTSGVKERAGELVIQVYKKIGSELVPNIFGYRQSKTFQIYKKIAIERVIFAYDFQILKEL